ncbi:protein kinase domain protein, partial [Ichthyophthirius multifiliis]
EQIQQQFPIGSIIQQKYRIDEKLGNGSFGTIYRIQNIETQETLAMKLEKRQQNQSSMLVREIKVMQELKLEKGFPRLQFYSKEYDYNFIIMTYLGKNLDILLRKCGGVFSLQTVLNIADQSLSRFESLHSKNLLHRDIKPDNFVIGVKENYNVIHLIDFGLAKYYQNANKQHIKLTENKGMIGTARYASLNAHLGLEQSRRDDLESLGYILVYFLKGELPWQNIRSESKEKKYELIKQMKSSISVDILCENLPQEFSQFFKYVKNLKFEEEPNYAFLKSLFKKIHLEKKYNSSSVDWEILPEYRHKRQIALFHGMGDQCINPGLRSFTQQIQTQLPNTYVKCIEIAYGASSSILMSFDKQLTEACNLIKSDQKFQNQTISTLGLSQGGLLARGIAQKCDFGGKVARIISIGGPQMGVATIPRCHSSIFCKIINLVIKKVIYTKEIQEKIGPAGYFKDPQNYEKYLKNSIFLPDLNNERNFDLKQKENILNIEKLQLTMFSKDKIIDPKETSFFAFYAKDGKTLINMKDSILYKNDLIGLQQLDKEGKIEFVTINGDHLKFTKDDIIKYYIPALK